MKNESAHGINNSTKKSIEGAVTNNQGNFNNIVNAKLWVL